MRTPDSEIILGCVKEQALNRLVRANREVGNFLKGCSLRRGHEEAWHYARFPRTGAHDSSIQKVGFASSGNEGMGFGETQPPASSEAALGSSRSHSSSPSATMADDGEAAEHELYGGDVPEENDGDYDLEGAGGRRVGGGGRGGGQALAAQGLREPRARHPETGAGDEDGAEDPASKVRP